jgi:Glycosyl transferase 4-like domain
MRGVWRALAPLTFALTSAPTAVWRIFTTRPDVVLCVEPTLFSAPAALLAAKIVGAKTVLHVQDLEIDAAFAVGHLRGGILRKIAKLFEGAVLRSFDRVVTISNRMRDSLESKGVLSQRSVSCAIGLTSKKSIRLVQQAPLSRGRRPPIGFASRPKVCTRPAMRLQTTADLSLIRGLVTRIDRCSSGASQCLESGRRSRSATCYYFLGFPHRDLTAGAMHAVLLLMCRTLPLQISLISPTDWPLRRVATLDESLWARRSHSSSGSAVLLGCAERSIPEARRGRASWREGLTVKARAKR